MGNASPLPDAQQRAASLAVDRYGADRRRVDAVVRAVQQARAHGKAVELIDTLVAQRLLTTAQATALRGEVAEAAPERSANGATDGLPVPPTSSGYYLRTLGPFRLLRRLGQGGMGSVYLGFEEGQGRQVAIKVLSDQLASNRAFVERFYREARSAWHVNHPNIVRCLQAGQDPATGKHYLVLEYVEGPSAQTLIEQRGRMSVPDAVRVTLDVARALEHAHSRNLIHRDVKPDNILITLSGVAKLADLGLAKRTDEASHLTALRQGFGSLHYIPYEQAYDAKQADGRSDIYALGATLYHLVTGEVPFPGRSHLEIAEKKIVGTFAAPSTLNPEVPAALEAVISKMLRRDPADRYQLVSEVIVDLERAGLAAPVPSFADPELARHDPLVQQSLSGAPPTQFDIQQQPESPPLNRPNPDLWYVRYRNREGGWSKTKMTAAQVLERTADGRLPAGVEVSRHAQGEYRPPSAHAELGQGRPAQASAPANRPSTANSVGDSEATVLPGRRWRVVVSIVAAMAVACAVVAYLWASRR